MNCRENQLSLAAKKLPVYECQETFAKLLQENQALVVVGQTGSGKTTQIPKWCLQYVNGQPRNKEAKQPGVACTQPRRIAAMSVSARVAKEMGVRLGEDVGYSVRFEQVSSNKTRLKYLTDGMLLREAILDHTLRAYQVIILDEAHERTLQTEILFGVIKKALQDRNKTPDVPTLKVVVMSATIDIDLFKKYFNAPSLIVEGRQHPVNDLYVSVAQPDLLMSTIITVFQIHRTCDEGDVLVFCSGQDEIRSLMSLAKKVLKEAPDSLKNMTYLPLYATLPASSQMKVFETNFKESLPATNGVANSRQNQNQQEQSDSSHRRVIFSTNVAETSVTIPNIKYVIDTGKVKCRAFNPVTGLDSLKVTTISKAQANQRSGRAGRVTAGSCYRLYTSDEFDTMDEHQLPEIKRCNLDGVILQMISIGINNIGEFDFLEKPEKSRIESAMKNLITLKAIKPMESNSDAPVAPIPSTSTNGFTPPIIARSYQLTNLGKKLNTFPLPPSMSRVIVAANELGCLDECLVIVSFLYIENIFFIPPKQRNKAEAILDKFRTNEGDLIKLLKVYKAFKRASTLNRSGLKVWCNEHFIHIKNLQLALSVRRQLSALCKGLGFQPSTCGRETTNVRRAFTYGFYNNVATMWNGKYRTRNSNEVYIHPSSCLFKSKPECIMYAEIIETNKNYMRNCSSIDMSWIREISASNLTSPGGINGVAVASTS